MASIPRLQLEQWLKTIDVKAERVLDVGGSQLPVEGRTKSWEIKEYKILDLETPHECKKKPDIILDLNEIWIEDRWDKEPNKDIFDVAFCLEVSEYWWNPVQALNNIAGYLKKGGILYISFSFNYGVHPPAGKDYLRYTRFGARKILEEAGFVIEDLVPRTCQMNSGFPEWIGFMSKQRMRFDKSFPGHNETGCLIRAIKK